VEKDAVVRGVLGDRLKRGSGGTEGPTKGGLRDQRKKQDLRETENNREGTKKKGGGGVKSFVMERKTGEVKLSGAEVP